MVGSPTVADSLQSTSWLLVAVEARVVGDGCERLSSFRTIKDVRKRVQSECWICNTSGLGVCMSERKRYVAGVIARDVDSGKENVARSVQDERVTEG